uniref:Fibronectin type-II domain-containing protein n=1 Tax=Pseudonaja textilis TaxID=8673 RepID=A0A670ZKC0_PSETE
MGTELVNKQICTSMLLYVGFLFKNIPLENAASVLYFSLPYPAPCSFPFIYRNKSYYSCTTEGALYNQLWCATTPNYDNDSKWKSCSFQEYGGNSNGQPCVFPFNYKGEEVTTCIDEDEKNEKNGRFWCATTENFDVDMKWSFCADTLTTFSKIAPSFEPCFFPFAYKKKLYSECTTDGTSGWKLWCSLTANYNTDHKWRYCEPSGKNRKLMSAKGFLHKNWEDTFIIVYCSLP